MIMSDLLFFCYAKGTVTQKRWYFLLIVDRECALHKVCRHLLKKCRQNLRPHQILSANRHSKVRLEADFIKKRSKCRQKLAN